MSACEGQRPACRSWLSLSTMFRCVGFAPSVPTKPAHQYSFSHFDSSVQKLSVNLICTSFMAKNEEQIFTHFLIIYTSFENSLFSLFIHSLIGWFAFIFEYLAFCVPYKFWVLISLQMNSGQFYSPVLRALPSVYRLSLLKPRIFFIVCNPICHVLTHWGSLQGVLRQCLI